MLVCLFLVLGDDEVSNVADDLWRGVYCKFDNLSFQGVF